jgi:hypothetical protein
MYGVTQPGHLGRRLMGITSPKRGPLKEIVFSALLVAAWRSRGASVGLGCLLGVRLRPGLGFVRLRTTTITHISSVRTQRLHLTPHDLVLLKVSPTHHPSFNTLDIIYYDTRVPRAYMIPKSHTWNSFTSKCE